MSRVRMGHRAEKLFHALHAFCIKEQQKRTTWYAFSKLISDEAT